VTPPRRPYATDLTDAEWQLLVPLISAAKPGGRPAIHDRRELVNAMAYWLQAGCAWQLLPHDLPPWQIEPGSGVPPSLSPSRSAPPSSASPCGSSSSRPAQ
jgi:transposase